MAGHLKKLEGSQVFVYNRDHSKALQHEQKYQTIAKESLDDLVSNDCSMIFLSLPTSREVEMIIKQICESPNFREGTVIIDTTSGEPAGTVAISEYVDSKNGVYFDCPVSGGECLCMY